MIFIFQGLDANGRPLLELHLRVQFYVDSASLVKDAGARRQYVRVLRQEAAVREAMLPAAVRVRLAALGQHIDGLRPPPPDQEDSELLYLREACNVDQLNAHCYRLRSHKHEPEPGSVRLYVRAAGLTVAPDSRPPASFPWPSIGKLSFDRKKFEIRAAESRITLYSSSDEKSKLLLSLCKETHQFSMKMAPKYTDILKREEEEKNCFAYTGTLNLPYTKDKNEQRISVISSTSSNTTSGIVSDRVHSEDELEIMIDSPPVSTVENSTLVRLTSDTPALVCGTQGSRCSSSGSTVVANAVETCVTPAASSETSGVYTMAGSAAIPVSDDGSLNYGSFRPRPRINRDASSLRSSSYQTESVSSISYRNLDGDLGVAPSECASFYNDESFISGDSVDGAEPTIPFRERADSGASGTGSFHGDGSDPTDRLHGPLSAVELSDLIVGRDEYPLAPIPPPPLVHEPQNSESDYVTLPRPVGHSYLPGHEDTAPSEDGYPDDDRPYSPPPPVPPKRIDSAVNHNTSLPNMLEAVNLIGNSALFQSASALFRPPPPYESDHQTFHEPRVSILHEPRASILHEPRASILHEPRSSILDCELSESLRELRLGIPVRDPPPYPGRAYPARFLPTGPHVTVLRAHASALTPSAEPTWAAPAPPPPLTVYTSQLARSQIEQYRRQLYSDVDYVVYPLQDPAISQQDYLDSKLAAMCPRGALCRSRGGGSTQALSDTYVRLPPCAIPPRREPPPPPFGRTVSDDNILNSLGSIPKSRRLPPPPPPSSSNLRRPPPREPLLKPTTDPLESIDIKTLREKSKNLDLPLIAALCNDKSLLKQTKAFVMPKHGDRERGERGHGKRPVSGSGGVGGKGPIRRGCHRHPGDALPALPHPTPRATANTYVPDPRPPAIA